MNINITTAERKSKKITRVYTGFVPENYEFFHTILFTMMNEERGLGEYKEKNGQGFKVTIQIEKVSNEKSNQMNEQEDKSEAVRNMENLTPNRPTKDTNYHFK